jgi:dynein heavy chain
MYKRAGIKGEGILFLFTDSQITDEKFLVFINDLLSSAGAYTRPLFRST